MKNPLIVPKTNGEIFYSFPCSQVADRMQENRDRLNPSPLGMEDGDGNALRSSCREELMGLIAAQQGEKPGAEPARKIILSGHQPLLCHPGVWIKNFLLHRIARKTGALAVNLEVDSDQAGDLAIPFPGRDKKLEIFREPLHPARQGAPLESLASPDLAQWGNFLARARSHVETLPQPLLAARLETLGRIGFKALKHRGGLSQFLTRVRRGYEGPAGLSYCSLPLSRVCGTKSFFCFFLEIVSHAERFAKVYNAALRDYRIRHKLRYTANPFPDLRDRDGLWELPFWWMDGRGMRKTIFSASGASKDRRSFLVEGEKPFEWLPPVMENAPEGRRPGPLPRIRPKALALTLFFRMFFCDLFIHGIGGAKYDQAADFIMRDYFGVTPPHYLAASLTLYPDLGIEGPPEGEMERPRASVRDMKFKPEKFIHLVSDPTAQREFRELCDAKQTLLRDPAREEKGKAFFRKINAINDRLAPFLDSARREMQRKLGNYQERAEEEKVRRFREYPFCLFDPLELARIAGTY